MYLLLVESITLVFTLPGVRSQRGTTLDASKRPNYPLGLKTPHYRPKQGGFQCRIGEFEAIGATQKVSAC